jgi:hypothetical protein
LADGFGALLEFQLEEAQDALEETEKLLDKAVEAREESAERMKEINEELRADDGQNKEELQQRLAEEDQDTKSKINTLMLHMFFMTAYDGDFYESFEVRRKQVEQILL